VYAPNWLRLRVYWVQALELVACRHLPVQVWVTPLTREIHDEFDPDAAPITPGYLSNLVDKRKTSVHSNGKAAAFVTKGSRSYTVDCVTLSEYKRKGNGATVVSHALKSIADTTRAGTLVASGVLLCPFMGVLFEKCCAKLKLDCEILPKSYIINKRGVRGPAYSVEKKKKKKK
jgi:hypothetical protein